MAPFINLYAGDTGFVMDKETIIAYMGAHVRHPASLRVLMKGMHIRTEDRPSFRRKIKSLTRAGEIQKIKGGKYKLAVETLDMRGVLSSNVKGFAFMIPEDGGNDVFLPQSNLKGGMDGDTVLCAIESSPREGRAVGQVVKIVQRKHSTITGIFQKGRGFAVVVPHDEKLFYEFYVSSRETMGAKSGQSVTVEIVKYPSQRANPEGKVIKILGYHTDPGVEVTIALAKYSIPSKFPTKVLGQAEKLTDSISKESIHNRQDLREKLVITIDGETAKDFDDAVSIEKFSDGYKLGVHIADVSHYVTPGSPIDKEAFKRGTSVYFPDRVVPMLPFELSNNICSLKPDVDRLTLSVFLTIDTGGTVRKSEFFESVIRSRERMTYTDVTTLLEGGCDSLKTKYQSLMQPLLHMKDLMALLQKEREISGSIDFDFPEPFIVLDAHGKPESIVKSERNVAHRLIEEFMLAANKAIAKRISSLEHPMIYRVHDRPDVEKVGELSEFLHNFGHRLNPENYSPLDFCSVLNSLKGKPEERLVSTVMLRHMRQAKYSTENIGHFGLAFSDYTHFTSPIRRYPDLLVHRILKETVIKSSDVKKNRDSYFDNLPEIAEHCSVVERRAEEAERDIVGLKKAQFMEGKIGDEFSGVISGVTSFGFFVELDKIFVEGLIHVSRMTDDYYFFDEKNHSLVGERLKKVFRIGDVVNVTVWDVSLERRKIDFNLAVTSP